MIALDVSPRMLQSRVRAGKIVNEQDIDRALDGVFKEQTLYMLRELLLRTVDSLTLPVGKSRSHLDGRRIRLPELRPGAVSCGERRRSHTRSTSRSRSFRQPASSARRWNGSRASSAVRCCASRSTRRTSSANDALRAVAGRRFRTERSPPKLANAPLPYDLFIVGAGQTYLGENPARSPYSQTAGDRLRVGYGKLTVYLGAAAGAGKTYAMLDRAHQLQAEGVDVVAGFVETHGRKETAALLDGLEVLPPKTLAANGITYREFDRDALIARHPQVALIDELAHTNAPGSIAPKRFHDVLAVLREGIDVITTLNIQHLEGLGDTVLRLTGTIVRETLPDGILALADEVILIDVTPETLRQRLREGQDLSARAHRGGAGEFLSNRKSLRAARAGSARSAARALSRARSRLRSNACCSASVRARSICR